MKIGYARVSTEDQTLRLQQDALRAAGCDQLFQDIASGSKTARPGLDDCLAYLREGDTLVVWRLDRLGRSLAHLMETVEDLRERGIGFMSVTEGFDTTTSGGKLIFHIFGAIAEFERNLIKERTNAGLAAARRRGKVGGRKRTISDYQIKQAIQLADTSEKTIEEICKDIGISVNSYYRRRKELLKKGKGNGK
ncbi:MAG: recombinase family protein [Chamaesiphon sp.]